MMKLQVYMVRWWDSGTEKLSRKFFLKKEVLIGADRSCDLRVRAEQLARLDFPRSEIEDLKNGSVQKLEEGQVFQLGDSAFQWQKLRLPNQNKQLLVGFLAFTALAMMLLFSCLRSEAKTEQSCLNFTDWFAVQTSQVRGDWTQSTSSLQTALMSNRPGTATAELETLRSMVNDRLCLSENPIHELKRDLHIWHLSRSLRHGDLKLSAELIRSASPDWELSVYEEEVLRRAEQDLWQAWRFENQRPEEALGIRLVVREVCSILRPGQPCFKQSAADQ